MPPKIKRYTNVVLSSNPCPDCKRANGVTMTMQEWKGSPFGIPGSDKRVCDGHCHCILVPEDMMKELPEIDKKAKLRGDKITDIGKTVDIYPNEIRLKRLMDKYNRLIGKLPPEIYDMPLNKVADYLDNLLKGMLPPTGVPGVPKKINIHENLSTAEKEIIKGWTHRDYIYIREYMTGSNAERLILKKNWGIKLYNNIKKKTKMMDNLFIKYKDGASANTIYRGLNELDESVYNQFKKYKVGETVEIDNSITSWTQNKEALEQYSAGRYGIRFHLKAGRILTKELDIDKYSFYGTEEMEVIVKDTRFKVTKIKESTHPEFKYQKRLDIYLEETGK